MLNHLAFSFLAKVNVMVNDKANNGMNKIEMHNLILHKYLC